MISESNSEKSSRNGDSINIDYSPISENKVIRDATWFVYNPKKQTINQPQSINKRPVRPAEFPGKRWGHSSIIWGKQIILFGGRHSHRSLANIYCFDLTNLSCSKIEPLGQTPPARDSHSAIIVK